MVDVMIDHGNLAPYEDQYLNNLRYIRNYGIREKNARTGVETLRVPSTVIVVDVGKEFPILTSKQIFWKTAADEMCWIHIKNDNVVANLKVPAMWSRTVFEDGTIGKSYGYQSGKKRNANFRNQLDYVIKTLKADPSSRHANIDLWDPEDLDEMALPPCVIALHFTVINGKLNCTMMQRSADYPIGVPFDTTQTAMIMHIVARELGVGLGILTHVMSDSHIYANQIDKVDEYLSYADQYRFPAPTLKIADKPWTELTWQDFEVVGYQHGPKISFELS